MIAAAPRVGAVSPLESVVGWFRARPWVFAYAVLTIWALMPEVRRLVDWKVGYNSISVISILPLISVLPFGAAVLYARTRRIARSFAVCAWLWFGGFAFSFAVGLANGDLFAATYTFAGFLVPIFFGLWLVSVDVPTSVLFDKISGFLLVLAVPVALYGAFQYVALPAWDQAWMRHASITSIGLPQPFLLRPFSTLNGPGPFADFLVAVLLLNLPRDRERVGYTGQRASWCRPVAALRHVDGHLARPIVYGPPAVSRSDATIRLGAAARFGPRRRRDGDEAYDGWNH